MFENLLIPNSFMNILLYQIVIVSVVPIIHKRISGILQKGASHKFKKMLYSGFKYVSVPFKLFFLLPLWQVERWKKWTLCRKKSINSCNLVENKSKCCKTAITLFLAFTYICIFIQPYNVQILGNTLLSYKFKLYYHSKKIISV